MIDNNGYKKFTDENLMLEIQKSGNHSAFETLYNRYYRKLFYFTKEITKDSLSAEDAAHEALIKVYYNADMYREIAKFSTWVYTIAGNLARTERIRTIRRSNVSIYDDLRFERDLGVIPDETQMPDDVTERKMVLEIVKWKIDRLSPRLKETITLRDLEEYSYEEISQILKIPIGTVKSRVNRGRLRLQKKLQYLRE